MRCAVRSARNSDWKSTIRFNSGVLENRFEYCGRPGHEIVFVFDAAFADGHIYSEEAVPVREPGWDGPAEWLDLTKPLPGPLYPDGLQDLLSSRT